MITSRKRIEETINFRKTDRIPIDLGGTKASGITVGAYTRLKEYLGLTAILVGPARLYLFDAVARKWTRAAGSRVTVTLPPGGGKLIRVQWQADS